MVMSSPKRRQLPRPIDKAQAEPPAATVLPLPVPNTSASAPTKSQPERQRIGDLLRRERERRGDDLQLIADDLCIRRNFLVAIENSRYEEFPADAYVIGFLRSYAEYLGLSGKEAIDYYRQEMAGRRNRPSLAMPIPVSEGRAPSGMIMIAAAVAALLVYALWYALSSTDRAAVVVPTPVPIAPISDTAPALHTSDVATPAPVASTPAPVVEAPQPAPAIKAETAAVKPVSAAATAVPVDSKATPVLHTAHISIRADQASWVLVNDTHGHGLFDRVMKAGEIYNVPNQEGLTLTTGNGSGITVIIDGVEQPKLAAGPSRVVRNVPLDRSGSVSSSSSME